MHREAHDEVAPLSPEDWRRSEPYLYGIDLFNHGYYWEAHESWESLWHAAGRRGEMADYLKGLIKLAAAAVKAREGNPSGVERHAARATQLLTPKPRPLFCGLDIDSLLAIAQEFSLQAPEYDHAQPEMLLDAELLLDLT